MAGAAAAVAVAVTVAEIPVAALPISSIATTIAQAHHVMAAAHTSTDAAHVAAARAAECQTPEWPEDDLTSPQWGGEAAAIAAAAAAPPPTLLQQASTGSARRRANTDWWNVLPDDDGDDGDNGDGSDEFDMDDDSFSGRPRSARRVAAATAAAVAAAAARVAAASSSSTSTSSAPSSSLSSSAASSGSSPPAHISPSPSLDWSACTLDSGSGAGAGAGASPSLPTHVKSPSSSWVVSGEAPPDTYGLDLKRQLEVGNRLGSGTFANAEEKAALEREYISRTVPLLATGFDRMVQAKLQLQKALRANEDHAKVLKEKAELETKLASLTAMLESERKATPSHFSDLADAAVASRLTAEAAERLTQLRVVLGAYFRTGPGDATVIHKISPGSAADRAGLRDGDRIMSLNTRATPTKEIFNARVSAFAPGDTVVLAIENTRGHRSDVRLTLDGLGFEVAQVHALRRIAQGRVFASDLVAWPAGIPPAPTLPLE